MGNFVYPFLTMFLTGKMGLGAKQAGFFLMLSAIVSVPGTLIGGKLADHFGRKKILILSQGLTAACFIPCAFLGTSIVIPWLLICASFVGGAVRPASSAMAADLTNPSNRREAFSLLYLGINIGFSIGPFIAGFLYYNYLKWIFIGDALTTFIALALIYIYVEETLPTEENIQESKNLDTDERAEQGSLFTVLLRRPALLVFSAIATIYSFVFAQHGFSVPIQIDNIFGQEIGSKMFGTIMATNGVVVVSMTVFVTKITKKLKTMLNIAFAGLFCAVGFGMMYYISSFPMFIVATIIWTIGEILNVTNSGVYIANHAPISHRGRFNAILPIITGSGFAISPYIMGGFIEKNGIRMVWPVTFVLAVCAAIMMYLMYIVEKRKENEVKHNCS